MLTRVRFQLYNMNNSCKICGRESHSPKRRAFSSDEDKGLSFVLKRNHL